jgi:hypothetical protein
MRRIMTGVRHEQSDDGVASTFQRVQQVVPDRVGARRLAPDSKIPDVAAGLIIQNDGKTTAQQRIAPQWRQGADFAAWNGGVPVNKALAHIEDKAARKYGTALAGMRAGEDIDHGADRLGNAESITRSKPELWN